MITFLEHLLQAANPARQQRLRLEIESDFAGTTVQQGGIARALDIGHDFKKGLGCFSTLWILRRYLQFAPGVQPPLPLAAEPVAGALAGAAADGAGPGLVPA